MRQKKATTGLSKAGEERIARLEQNRLNPRKPRNRDPKTGRMKEKWADEGVRREAFDEVCERVAGGETLSNILTGTKHLPSRTVFRNWLYEDLDMYLAFEDAKKSTAALLVDQCLAISDESIPETVPSDKVKIQTRQWIAARLDPASWSESNRVEHTGPDRGPIKIEVEIVDPKEMKVIEH